MAKMKCPQCNKTQTFPGRYDDKFDDLLTCTKCGLTVRGL